MPEKIEAVETKSLRPLCPVCSSEDVEPEGHHKEYALVACKSCGLGFSAPMRTSAEFYEQSVDYLIRDRFIVDPLVWEKRWDIEQFFKRSTGRSGRLFDIGCGTGFFVKRARDIGYDAFGIETDSRAVKQGRKHFALDTLHEGTLKDYLLQNPESGFDLVTMFQVLEHLEDPVTILQEIRRLLSPEGLLVMSLPCRDRWPDALGEVDRPPHHLTRWSTDAISVLLEKTGFSVREILIENFPLQNMVGIVYHQVLRLIPSLTIAGKKGSQGPGGAVDVSPEAVVHMLRKRKLKMLIAEIGSFPLWLLLKALGAKGPHMYIEAVPAENEQA